MTIEREATIRLSIFREFCTPSIAGTITPKVPKITYEKPTAYATSKKATLVPKTNMKAPRSFFSFKIA